MGLRGGVSSVFSADSQEPVTSILQKQAADISVEDGPYFVMELCISSTHAALQETRRGA